MPVAAAADTKVLLSMLGLHLVMNPIGGPQLIDCFACVADDENATRSLVLRRSRGGAPVAKERPDGRHFIQRFPTSTNDSAVLIRGAGSIRSH